LHLRVTPETKNSINKDLLGLMKPTAYLINTSRAGVLCREDLIEALEKKMIGGAALDVFWEEPLKENDPLLRLDNLTMTPHNAGNVVDALPKSPLLLVKTITEYWETKKSDMVVNLRNITC
ncbi:MAG: phosphoglycerate dehydrogenase, partial [Lachnospiraceae bacterium]|nr:phosphoglycerate dehydrogenase [Lachnospiraceae bacterium]